MDLEYDIPLTMGVLAPIVYALITNIPQPWFMIQLQIGLVIIHTIRISRRIYNELNTTNI